MAARPPTRLAIWLRMLSKRFARAFGPFIASVLTGSRRRPPDGR